MYKYFCYHHNDMDGMFAAYEIYDYIHEKIINTATDKDEVLIPLYRNFHKSAYTDPFIAHKDLMGDDLFDVIFIVDISFTAYTFYKLQGILKDAKKVIWIDHHKTSLDFIVDEYGVERLETEYPNLVTVINTRACGALLSWIVMRQQKSMEFIDAMSGGFVYLDIEATYDDDDNGEYFDSPMCGIAAIISCSMRAKDSIIHYATKQVYPSLLFVDDYDRWVLRYDNSKAFHLGWRTSDNFLFDKAGIPNPGFTYLHSYDDDYIDELIDDGKVVIKYTKAQYESELSGGFECYFGDILTFCKNGWGNSDNFGYIINDYPMVCLYHYSGKSDTWAYSIYSAEDKDGNQVDVSEIAKKLGGGGHPGASGFNTPGDKGPIVYKGAKIEI